MNKFNMLSHHFSHDVSSTVNQTPKFFSWDFNTFKNEISFYIDQDLLRGFIDNKSKKKYLWTLESPYFNNGTFELIETNFDKVINTFDMIFTYNTDLISLHEKFKWAPAMGSWIKKPEIHTKTKIMSMITSDKTYTPQQKFRNQFAIENKNLIDIYGRGFNEIPHKEDGLNDYMFSVCIENNTSNGYFTEKILDCFATGTIPIYKGTKKILDHFDSNGIIFLDDINLQDINSDLYYSKFGSVTKNFNLVKSFILPEDYIYLNYLNNL